MNRTAVGYGRSVGLVYYWFLALLTMTLFVFAGHASAARVNGGILAGFPPAPVLAPAAVPPQFDITGFMQHATVAPVGSMCPSVTDPRLMGGTVTLNGQLITVPCNTILQMPAAALTWADLFTMAPKDTTPTGTGMALTDPTSAGTAGLLNSSPTSYDAALPSFEIHVVGNVINGQYIAGLVFISQQSLNGGQGIISCIDYDSGEMQVGGVVKPHGTFPCPALHADGSPVNAADGIPGASIARVRMNDPVGRYGLTHGGPGSGADVIEAGYDARFTADTDNPTMHSALGFPICVPRGNPFQAGGLTTAPALDPLCPMSNRPISPNCPNFPASSGLPPFGGQAAGYCTTWVMDPPKVISGCPGLNCPTDPTRAAPLVHGDTISFSGTLKADAKGPYISAHTIDANLGIYTTPHTQPSYVFMEGVLVGTGGGTIGGLALETTGKLSWVGFASDPTELVDFYSLHQDPLTGEVKEFFLGTQDPCCTPLGRFRTVANNQGAFGEPTRNYRAVSRNACQAPGATAPLLTGICHMDPLVSPDASALQASLTPTVGGLVPGQYLLPNFEFIFAENLNFGTPLVPNNLQDLPFLYCGSGPIDGPGTNSTVVGQLDPAPWAPPMSDPIFRATYNGCANVKTVAQSAVPPAPPSGSPVAAKLAPVTATPATATVGVKATIQLSVTASDPNVPPLAPLSFTWSAPGAPACGTPGGVCLSSTTTANPIATFTSSVAGTITFQVVVNNGSGLSATGSIVIPVAPTSAKAPVLKSFKVNPTGTVNGGTLVTLTAVGNANPTFAAPLGTVSFTFAQTGGPAVTIGPVTVTGTAPNDQTGTATFFAPSGPALTLTFSATVIDSLGQKTTSSATAVTVKVNATAPDTITINAVSYLGQGNVGGVTAQRGKLSISASSTANPAPPGMTMTATFFNSSLPASVPGSSALPLSSPMLLVIDPLLCPTAAPCWTTLIQGVIQDTSVTPAVDVPPTTVTLKSSLGGTATATGAAIVVR